MNETSENKRGWRILRRILIGLAILATLIAIFYTEEDWRGKRAWENCKHELEAKGVVLDWDKFIPPPVPDDQNFFTASTNILLRFKKAQTDAEFQIATQSTWLRIVYATNAFPRYDTLKTPLVVADLKISPPATTGLNADTNVLDVTLDDPRARERVGDAIRRTVGPNISGAAGFKFSEFQLSNISPAQIFVHEDTTPSIQDLESIVPTDVATNLGQLRIAATANKEDFQILLSGSQITTASDYLKWSDQFEPALDEIRAALKRPYAILPGDYSVPYAIPIPNFITMRSVAQMLAQRAQCDFLLGQPDRALHELTLVHDICRILEKPPTGKPETLVEAMINVAIAGLYVDIITEGLQRHAWQEPQLVALQEQLKASNVVPFVCEAFRTAPASECRDLETMSLSELKFMMSMGVYVTTWLKIRYYIYDVIPRGWIYQNMAVLAKNGYEMTEGFDLTNNLILPQKTENWFRKADATIFRHNARPYDFVAAYALPNITKAIQVTAHNQTMVNEAQIACALERYHLVHNEYPETLDALAPRFIAQVPHDIIGGQPSQGSGSASQPLHYCRTDDGKFLLYSVGWNGKDEGGKQSLPIPNIAGGIPNGNWVLEN